MDKRTNNAEQSKEKYSFLVKERLFMLILSQV
jgi:hypothetical protein